MSTPEKTETEYQLGVPVEGTPVDDANKLPKQGHKCCGGCCDVRRAVMIVNIVNATLLLFGMFGVLATNKLSGQAEDLYDDDEMLETLAEFSNSFPLGAFIAIQVVKILCSVAGIIGALKFNIYLTGVAAAAYCIDVLMALIEFSVGGIVYAALFAYPHFYFIKEVRAGIMSKENYHNEEMSCCCV